MHQYIQMDAFIVFLVSQKILIDIKIVSLLCLVPKIWPCLLFHGGRLEIQDGRHKQVNIKCAPIYFYLARYSRALCQILHFYHNFNDFHKNSHLPPVLN